MPATSSTKPGSCLPGLVSVVGTIFYPTHHCIGFDRSDQKKPFFTHNHCSSPRVSGQTDSDVSLHDVQRSGRGCLTASTQPNLLSCLRRILIVSVITKATRSFGGARRDRTDDILLAKQALSQLSYGPIFCFDRPFLPKTGSGWPGWTRTTDLTLIRRAL